MAGEEAEDAYRRGFVHGATALRSFLQQRGLGRYHDDLALYFAASAQARRMQPDAAFDIPTVTRDAFRRAAIDEEP